MNPITLNEIKKKSDPYVEYKKLILQTLRVEWWLLEAGEGQGRNNGKSGSMGIMLQLTWV
jgi:hypothetical protein